MQINKKYLKNSLLLLLLFQCKITLAQNENIGQFWNELAFTRPLGKAWSSEFNIGQVWSDDNKTQSILANHAQLYLRQWIHYYPNARWKTSFFIAYFNNKQIEGIAQPADNEWRWALQAMYYIKKIGYTLNTRTRIENRGITNSEGTRETGFRFRQQLRLLYPFGGSKIIRGKVWYLIASDEVMFKTTGDQLFDKNRLTVGPGYSITDDIQIETTYVNEYLPRPQQNIRYHAFQLNVVFNNLLTKIGERWKKKPNPVPAPVAAED